MTTKYKKRSNRSDNKTQDFLKKLEYIDNNLFHQGTIKTEYKLKQSDSGNHYVVFLKQEQDELLYTIQQVLSFCVEYESEIRTFFMNELAISVPLFGEPTARLRRDPMAGYKQRNQQSPLDVIGGLQDKISRIVFLDENISREMITRFNSLMRYLFKMENGLPLWKMDAQKVVKKIKYAEATA